MFPALRGCQPAALPGEVNIFSITFISLSVTQQPRSSDKKSKRKQTGLVSSPQNPTYYKALEAIIIQSLGSHVEGMCV